MNMLPNDHHPGPRCSCGECQRRYPETGEAGGEKAEKVAAFVAECNSRKLPLPPGADETPIDRLLRQAVDPNVTVESLRVAIEQVAAFGRERIEELKGEVKTSRDQERERIAALTEERDEARRNYQFMVDRAADEKLDGYRALSQRVAQAEEDRDRWKKWVLDADQRNADTIADLERARVELDETKRQLASIIPCVEHLGVQCKDGGTCHHECKETCFRKRACVPLSACKWLNDDWSPKLFPALPSSRAEGP